MKKLVFIMIIGLSPLFLLAQGTPLSSLYDKYATDPDFNTTEIKPGSMNFDWEKSMDNAALKDILKDIQSIRFLKSDDDMGRNAQNKLWKKILKTASDSVYMELASVNADDVKMKIYIMKGSEGVTREVALLVKEEDGVILGTMTGNMNFSALFSHENLEQMREMAEHFMQMKSACKHDEH
jgi:hypothetical protein